MDENQPVEKRKYIGIQFECCGTYARIYFNKAQNAYVGRCPKCLKNVKVMVDKERGTSQRFFKAE